MTTALILRPDDKPQPWVLEVDGPRRKYVQRGEGSYYLGTTNHPDCFNLQHRFDDGRRGGVLTAWDQPYWEIYQQYDGRIEVHACRPTIQEVRRGDMHGYWGSVIKLGIRPRRGVLRVALQLARVLAKCLPTVGFTIEPSVVYQILRIETLIPVRLSSGGYFQTPPSPA